MDNKGKSAGGGMGICSVLTIVFIVLKLAGVIDWKWVWVLCPAWGQLVLVIVGFFVYCFSVALYKYFNEKK